mmetsp:Transcript_81120/g.216711  ORF Transcript_81120/g.216711 Transcript_81120/m.216711 type:complete len:204 (+) Transcript_81120:594-1205(+)
MHFIGSRSGSGHLQGVGDDVRGAVLAVLARELQDVRQRGRRSDCQVKIVVLGECTTGSEECSKGSGRAGWICFVLCRCGGGGLGLGYCGSGIACCEVDPAGGRGCWSSSACYVVAPAAARHCTAGRLAGAMVPQRCGFFECCGRGRFCDSREQGFPCVSHPKGILASVNVLFSRYQGGLRSPPLRCSGRGSSHCPRRRRGVPL